MTAAAEQERSDLIAARALLLGADRRFAEAILESSQHPRGRQILALVRSNAIGKAIREIDDALADGSGSARA